MQHHAILIQVPQITVSEALLRYGETGDYEVYVLPFSVVGIGEVRQLILEASRRPQTGTARLLVVRLESITFEAQQALLKILEEPPETTLFLFVVPGEVAFIATLLSRFQTLTTTSESELRTIDFTEFIKSPLAKRLEEIGKRTTKKDLVWILSMKSGLKHYLKSASRAEAKLLPTLSLILTQLNTRGASNKLLLEELALTLPIRA